MKHLRMAFSVLLAVVAVVGIVLLLVGAHDRVIKADFQRLVSVSEDDDLLLSNKDDQAARLFYELCDSALRSRTRLAADLLAAKPSLFENDQSFSSLVRALGVDELHISNDKGVMIRSVPEAAIGFDMASIAQSSEFLPALTNRDFELVQEGVKKATDGAVVTYCGVARRDRPGIVQLGYRQARWVGIRRFANAGSTAKASLARHLESLSYWSRDVPFFALCLVTVIAVALLVLVGRAGVRDAIGSFHFCSPLTAVLFLVFTAVTVSAWLTETYSVRHRAEGELRANLEATSEEFDGIQKCILDFAVEAAAKTLAKDSSITVAQLEELRRNHDIDRIDLLDASGQIRHSVGNALGETFETTAALSRGEKLRFVFVSNRLSKELDFVFDSLSKNWHVSGVGFCVCARIDTGEIESSSSPSFRRGDTLAGVGFDVTLAEVSGAEPFETELFGEHCLCMSTTRFGRRLIIAMPLHGLFADRNLVIGEVGGLLAIVFIFLALYMRRLASLLEKLRRWIAADAQARQKDARLAYLVQQSTIPKIFPDNDDYRIRGSVSDTVDVGGVFFDFYELPSGRLFLFIADVVGSGVPAAMFMMRAKSVIEACAKRYAKPSIVAAEANRMLSENNDAGMKVMAWLASYDRQTGAIDYAEAGLPAAEKIAADGQSVKVPPHGSSMLGGGASACFEGGRLTLAEGERLVLVATETEGGPMTATLDLQRRSARDSRAHKQKENH